MPRPDYIVPNRSAPESERLGWLREAVQQGDNFLRSNRGYQDIDFAMDVLAGDDGEKQPSDISDLYINRIKRQIREIVAVESNIRPLWGYRCEDERYADTERVLNDLLKSWWLTSFADRSLRKALQWGTVAGTGWVHPTYERDSWHTGRGDIRLHIFGPRDVKPVQMPRDMDIQRAYAVIICSEVPVNLARAMFPQHAHRIKPDRSEPRTARGRKLTRLSRYLSPVLRIFEREHEDVVLSYPTVDVFNAYIMDAAINTSGRTVPMGEAGSNWSYETPYLGQEIATNIMDPISGQPLMRKASWEDCRLYPQRRLITFTNTASLYDDTSPRWDGKVPLAKFTTDDWPWEFLGFSAVKDVYSIQKALNELARGVQDKCNVGLRPPLGYDPNAVSPALAERFDPRRPGQKIRLDWNQGQPIRPILEALHWKVEPEVLNQMAFLMQQGDYLLALPDMTALAKAAQIPSTDTVDKILEVSGPIVTDISRSMESSLRDLGELVKVMFFQYYGAKRRMEMLGPDGLTRQDWDFDPGALLPSHLPGEDRSRDSAAQPWQRLRQFHNLFSFRVVPNSAHQITQMQRKLIFVQLWRAGFPIDPWTMGEQLDLPFGKAPAGRDTIHDRWMAWLEEQSAFTATIQALAQLQASMAVAQATGGAVPPEAVSGGGNGSAPGAGMGQPRRGVGRPPTGAEPPRVQTKDGGTRTTITES